MAETYKEKLSEHVESIFKGYATTGLHICDIATGGGKSYTIGKLTCEFYPEKFDRIIILCVQNKLVDSMNREIDRFINGANSLISPTDKLVIENNQEVITKAVKSGAFQRLLDRMNYHVGEQWQKGTKTNTLQYTLSGVKKAYEGLSSLIKSLEANGRNEFIESKIDEGEANLRKTVRRFFDVFRKHLENTKQLKNATLDAMLSRFPELAETYPQVNYRYKKVLLMTVHKAIYGIDPILYEKINLQDMSDRGKRTLVLFDESDQAAVAIRSAIIDQSIKNNNALKGYDGYLQYKSLIDNPESISNQYYENLLENGIKKAQTITENNWKRSFQNVIPYNDIFLDSIEEIESYRRGVFFSGPALKLNVAPKGDNTNSYICYREGDRHLSLAHAKDGDLQLAQYSVVIPLDKFLALITSNTTAVKSQFRKVIAESLERSRDKFKQESKDAVNNHTSSNLFLGYPTLEREIHTLFSRFKITSLYQFEQQMLEFMTNRKNLFVGDDKKIKLPDFSVYSQGVQFYQEEIDELDNQHRVRLTCREISTTPEKILIDLVSSEKTSVVLCSATASSWSVVSNYDIKYLKQTLGDKIHTLSKTERETFDNLVERTYPKEHCVEIVPLEKYEYTDKRENSITLPEKYRQDKWFKVTYRSLKKTAKDMDDLLFQLYRLYQFIETYYWFIHHDDVHSMIYFQNRTGDKDKEQIHLLSCLIGGTYKCQDGDFDDEFPTKWENKQIRISKDLEDVETKILPELSQNKDAKLMLVTAYGSFKAGTNLQYEIPVGLDYILGDNWDNESGKRKKDWDAIYVQSPTAYLMMNEDGSESTFEKSLYNAMLTLMMLYERGCLSKNDVSQWLFYAVTNALSKDSYIINNLNYNPGLIKTIDSIFLESALEQSTYFFHENSKTTTILENTDILCAFYIWMQNSQQFYERRYKKLQDLLSEIGGFANLIMMIAYCINYLIARFNMLIDTKELISNIIKKDISIYENIVKKQSLKKYIDGNNNKQNEDNSNINIIESENNQNIIINKENIDKGKDKDKKIIINRINVINSNKGEETNRMNKKDDFIEKEIVKIHKSRTFAKIRRMSTKKLTIKRDFASISDNDFFSCFSYFFYIMFCKRNNSKIKYYEELRRLIISEECMIQNYLNIYKLLEAHNFT